ncbi:hypothetical protein [Leptospira santarosai]|uniref:hypothetical protein n=1 Tax=Leptospira santarosai TaxID=28183 RepID=UPI00051999AA|nr:hypothetical protein [Leptospira santarosai]KXZ28326.1 hypothetical protein AYB33_17900 [Leptospira santarosai]MDI7156251.1 hypothetical protein [Leptospira santarosai]
MKEEKQKKAHMKNIALIKFSHPGFVLSTDRAIFVAEREGIIPAGTYKRSTVDRLLIKYKMSARFKKVTTGK